MTKINFVFDFVTCIFFFAHISKCSVYSYDLPDRSIIHEVVFIMAAGPFMWILPTHSGGKSSVEFMRIIEIKLARYIENLVRCRC